MSKESIAMSMISLIIVIAAGFFVLKVIEQSGYETLQARIVQVESKLAVLDSLIYTHSDHEHFLKQDIAADQITQTRFVRIFDKFRVLEKQINEHCKEIGE